MRPALRRVFMRRPTVRHHHHLPKGSNPYSKRAQFTTGSVSASMTAAYAATVVKRPELAPVPDDAAAKAHHVTDRNGKTVKFQNPNPSFQPPVFSFKDLLSFLWGQLTGRSDFPKPTGQEIHVETAKFLPERVPESDDLRVTWLGHSSCYVEFPSGFRALFDPVFEDVCAPVSFLARLKRYSKTPISSVADLPYIDAVFISHSHYDHLSYPTVLEIQKHHPNVHFFVGLGLEKWARSSGLKNVTELDWWDGAEITLAPAAAAAAAAAPEKSETEVNDEKTSHPAEQQQPPITAQISCLPCQHGSGRSLLMNDQAHTLWCSWGLSSGGKSVWFGGDTGYRAVPKVPEGVDDYGPDYAHLPVCPYFRQIGELRGPFDLGLIPIGAYDPRHLFSGVHGNPFDAVNIFADTRCKRAMAIHWGTWVLTREEVLEPPRKLKEALKRKGLPETGVFDVFAGVGESRVF